MAVLRELSALPAGTTVIHGAARGADRLAGEAARSLGLTVRADWKRHGRAAGPIRNSEMLKVLLATEGEHRVIGFSGGRGTADMLAKARAVEIT